MLKLCCFLLGIIYIYIVFLYSSNAFLKRIQGNKFFYIFFALNSVILGIFLFFDVKVPEFMFMLLYFIFICIEFKIVFNDKWLKSIFGGLCSCINFFALRLFYISMYSLMYKKYVFNIMQDYRILTILTIFTFLTTIICIFLFFMFAPINFINMISTDKENLKFSVRILSIVYLFLILNSIFLYVQVDSNLISMLNIKISILSLVGFSVALFYSYLFAKFQLYVVKAENIQKELIEDEIALKELENEANYDYFTSCLKRDVIFEKIDKILNSTPFCCIVFIDIDGLKITNDVYGHDEGDFYIKEVSDILISEFVGKSIGRIGGDEFLVVLEHTDIYATMKCVLRCYERANNISKLFNKEYQTSISYGIVEVLPDNKLSREEIIKLADSYMYNFKKSRKKNRR